MDHDTGDLTALFNDAWGYYLAGAGLADIADVTGLGVDDIQAEMSDRVAALDAATKRGLALAIFVQLWEDTPSEAARRRVIKDRLEYRRPGDVQLDVELQRKLVALEMRAQGHDFDSIALRCGYFAKDGSPNRSSAHKALQSALNDVITEASQDFVDLQVVRLEQMLAVFMPRALQGEYGAMDRVLTLMRELERYKGALPTPEVVHRVSGGISHEHSGAVMMQSWEEFVQTAMMKADALREAEDIITGESDDGGDAPGTE